MSKKGILLVNLGTPDSPETADVKKYLDQFLMDERVIDIPKLNRILLIKGIIVPFRSPKTAKLYKEIWNENGSPLLYYSRLQAKMLQERLGDDYHVELAMRYQNPSIESALANLKAGRVDSIQVIPLFPQYASASTGSVLQLVMKLVSKWHTIPPISFVNSFHDNELMIKIFAENARKHNPESYDHVLFSFHGLPERQIDKGDYFGKNYNFRDISQREVLNDDNKFCYLAQSYDTARLIAKELNLSKENYTVCFQSRLGKEPWVQPYTTDVLKKLAAEGKKRLLVFSPAFVADCLETLYEITVEYHEEFRALGGEHVQLVESLNDSPVFIEALAGMVK
ncbi:ferrochelatase [Pedobacter chinensis]|uniref:Ferrochelatase n=1 Tax=Pedobacter chinensis TaxID=2282421 RepID=A0A369PXR3_9SPHI|nr:ferrochelatase [Pedobacter chinensis]RDC54878.1 ferrochelatase [Pedobacter chinensis]